MKGIVFTEFFEMVEKKFGYEVVDHIIESSNLESDGVYTSVGTYHHSEIVQLLTNLSIKVNIPSELLLKEFGSYLFHTFQRQYPQFFKSSETAFEFLHSVDKYIHVEVKKLYPDANLPRFYTKEEKNTMTMLYRSERSMSSLAVGLIEQTMKHYNEEFDINVEAIKMDGSEVKITIFKKTN